MGKAAVLIFLVATVSWAQEVSVNSTTFAQYYKTDIPGLDGSTFAPLTQFMSIDVSRMGAENLSMHLFGWGNFGLADQTRIDGQSTGSLSYGYVRYRFDQANGELKAGRFSINHGFGFEQIDGASGKTDLKGGFSISAFGGRPVYYKTQVPEQQYDYEYLRDAIFGSRLSYRLLKIGEVGISFVQNGTSTSVYSRADIDHQPHDYRRKLIGGDFYIVPMATLLLTGRTVFDIADHTFGPTNWDSANRLAENDYSLAYKLNGNFSMKANYTERNFQAYFSGSNFPSLFSTFEKDKHRSYTGSATYSNSGSYEVTADYRQIYRETFGNADRFGGDVRWNNDKAKLVSGFGYHRINTSDVKFFDPAKPSYSLSHHEIRFWAFHDTEKFITSLDGMIHIFDDSNNPHLNGQSSLYELIASAGLKPNENLRISADILLAATAMAKTELRALVRLDYKFGFTGFKGSK